MRILAVDDDPDDAIVGDEKLASLLRVETHDFAPGHGVRRVHLRHHVAMKRDGDDEILIDEAG